MHQSKRPERSFLWDIGKTCRSLQQKDGRSRNMENSCQRRVPRVDKRGRIGLFVAFLLVHKRVGKSEQLFERLLANPWNIGDADAQGEAEGRPIHRIGDIQTFLPTLADL